MKNESMYRYVEAYIQNSSNEYTGSIEYVVWTNWKTKI